jgi:excisionase family DNA binding protein
MNNKLLYSIQEASGALGLSVSSIYRLTSKRKIPHIKIGSRVMFVPEQLESWIREQCVEPVDEILQ